MMRLRPMESECIKHNFIDDNNFFVSVYSFAAILFHHSELMKYIVLSGWPSVFIIVLLVNVHFITFPSMATITVAGWQQPSVVDLLNGTKAFMHQHKSDTLFFFLFVIKWWKIHKQNIHNTLKATSKTQWHICECDMHYLNPLQVRSGLRAATGFFFPPIAKIHAHHQICLMAFAQHNRRELFGHIFHCTIAHKR